MHYGRNNFTQNMYRFSNFEACRDENCLPAYYVANDRKNVKDAMLNRFESLVETLGCYVLKSRDVIAYVEDSRFGDELIDTFESIVDKSKKISLVMKKRVNIANFKEQAIDDFEGFVDKSRKFGIQTTNKLRKVQSIKEIIKKEAMENLESFIDKTKGLRFQFLNNTKQIKLLQEKVIMEFEHLLEKINSKTGSVGRNIGYFGCDKEEEIIEGFGNAGEFDNLYHKIKVDTQNKTNKLVSIKDEVMDDFEYLMIHLKTYVLYLEENVKYFVEEKGGDVVEDFDTLLWRMRNFGCNVVEKTNDQAMKVNFMKEDIVDSFENLLCRLNNLGLQTNNEMRQKLNCIKEEVVDDFEDLVQFFNMNLRCIEDSLIGHTNRKKMFIVEQFEDIVMDLKNEINRIDLNIRGKVDKLFDEFEDMFDETKCMFEKKADVIFYNANFAFGDIVGRVEEAFECGRCDVEAELHYMRYWLLMGEMLVKDFLCYSERMVEEFCRFSEKRLACFLCQGKQKAQVFYNEVVDSLVRGFEDKLLCDNLVLEINSSRYAYNVTMSEVNFHVVRALLTLPAPDGRSWQNMVSRLSYFMPILTNYIRTEAAQKDCLLAIEDVAGSHPEIFSVLVKIIHWLYEKDILSEDIIMDWYNNPCKDSDPENSKRVRKQVSPFINWLQEAEEDDDDEDED